MVTQTKNLALADKFAVSASTLCAAHCLALPFMVSMFPAISATVFGEEAFHVWLLWAIIPLSAFSLSLGCRRHKNMSVGLFGVLGVGTMVLTAFLGHAVLGENGERCATLLGATTVAVAHVQNYRYCRRDECAH